MSKTAVLVAAVVLAAGGWLTSSSFGESSSSTRSSQVRPVLGGSQAPVVDRTGAGLATRHERDARWSRCHRHQVVSDDGALVGPSDQVRRTRSHP